MVKMERLCYVPSTIKKKKKKTKESVIYRCV